jgi:hypothetical protein
MGKSIININDASYKKQAPEAQNISISSSYCPVFFDGFKGALGSKDTHIDR